MTDTTMKLWLIRPKVIEPKEGVVDCSHRNDGGPWDSWPDTAVGFIVRAATEEEARLFADARAGDEKRYGNKIAWLDDSLSACTELLADGNPGIIMRDFLHG